MTILKGEKLDSSLAFKAEGYRFIGERCQRFGSDISEGRLLGKPFYCVRGDDAAQVFDEPDQFTRKGALPASTLKLLQDKGSVATLDATAHRHRKAMFMSLMTPPRLESMASLAADELRATSMQWQVRGRFKLHRGFRAVLCRAVYDWAGVSTNTRINRRLTRQIGAMIDNAGTVGPANWVARMRRWRTEAFLRRVVHDVRAGRSTPPSDSAAQIIALHRDEHGELLPPQIAAVKLLNILRPTVAIARFMTFAALALHQHPDAKERLVRDNAYLEVFVQKTRRISPFFPIVADVARESFAWQDRRFQAGDRFILGLYGTDHDGRLWDDPEVFRPERSLDWSDNRFSMIPQGGCDHDRSHPCAGEWLTIAVMRAMLRALAQDMDYEVPPQDLSVSPNSGVVIRVRPA